MKPIRTYNFLKFAGVGAAALSFPIAGKSAEPDLQALEKRGAPRPNIIFILADDLGFEDLGCYGGVTYKGLGPVKTPNLDAMAKEGMLFKYAFACPVCSPSRSELLTGKYNFRTGFRRILGAPGVPDQLDFVAHPTVATRLKKAGYVTAVVGKWHVGPPGTKGEVPKSSEVDTDYPHPRECGFDRQCIFSSGHLNDYSEPKPGKYTPELLQNWALKFLTGRKGEPSPFFLYYASPFPHIPLYATPLNPDGSTARSDLKNYPYLIEYLDRQVGELLDKLTELGLRENTLVMFAGDNGSYKVTTQMRDGREILGGKGTPLDTGSWVPLLASWPRGIPSGSVYNGMVDFTDILPTCLELAGSKATDTLDGISFAPQLQGKPGAPREWSFSLGWNRWYVRDTKWKLRETGALYDVSDSPYVEALIKPENDTPESKMARVRLQAVLDKMNPGVDRSGLKEKGEKSESDGGDE
jgi:arylsulfatase A-like enzyme